MIYKMILFFIVFILGNYYDYTRKKHKEYSKYILMLIALLLATFFAMREFIIEDIGTDYYVYKDWYNNITADTINLNSIDNLGYNIINLVSKMIFKNYYVFLFLCGGIINLLILKFIDRNSETFTFSMAIYMALFYKSTFNTMRQWIACAILLFAFSYITEGKKVKYIICCLTAMLFHSTAILLLPMYLILKFNDRMIKKECIILGIGIFLIVSDFSILQLIFENELLANTKYLNYATYIGGTSNYLYPTISAMNLLLLNILNLRNGINDRDRQKIVYLSLTVIISILSMQSIVFYRFAIYFLPSLLLTIPMTLKFFKTESRRVLSILFSIIFLCIFI